MTPYDADRTVPASPLAATSDRPHAITSDWRLGDVILDLYDVLGVAGEGGMGTVYRVHHRTWDVDLAVKSPRPDILKHTGGAATFERECDAWVHLGMHSHIVSCHYVRVIGDTPRAFIEYVDGGSLAEAIRTRSLYAGDADQALRRVLDVAIQSARGLHYIHEQELVHQDVKPANVMLTRDGTAKITDFGLARALGGTPEYFSPEQAESLVQKQDTVLPRQTDVWSWALMLIEMLQGERTWSVGEAGAEVLRMGVSVAPELPFAAIPGPLQQLLARCFDADPWARPEMSAVVSELLEIYTSLTNDRYPRPLSETVALKASAMNNRGASFIDLRETEKAIASWERVLEEDAWNLEARFNIGYARWQNGDITDIELVTTLTRMEPTYRSRLDYWRLLMAVQEERGDIDTAEQLRAQHASLNDVPRSSGAIGKMVRSFGELKMNWYSRGTLSADGCMLATIDFGSQPALRLYDVATGKERRCLLQDNSLRTQSPPELSADGARAAAGVGAAVGIWDTKTGREITTHEGKSGERIIALALSPDGLLAASAGENDRAIELWDASTGRLLKTLGPIEYRVVQLKFSPDSHRLLSASTSGQDLIAWDTASGDVAVNFDRRRRDHLYGIAFSRDGRFVLSTESGGILRLWDAAAGREITSVRNDDGPIIENPCLSSDGRFAFINGARYLRLWDLQRRRVLRTIQLEGTRVSIGFLPDDRHVVLTAGRSIQVWHLNFDDVHPRHFPALSKISGALEAAADAEKALALLTSAEEKLEAGDVAEAVALARNAQTVSGYERRKEVLDLLARCQPDSTRTGLRDAWVAHPASDNQAIALSPDGSFAAEVVRSVLLRDVETWSLRAQLMDTNYTTAWMSFSPDSRRVLTLSHDVSPARVHDVQTGEKLFELAGGDASIHAMVFLPGGDRVLSGGSDGSMKIWDLASGKVEASFSSTADDRYNRGIGWVEITADGRLAVTCGRTDFSARAIQVWDLVACREIARLQSDRGRARCVRVSPDGRTAISGESDGMIRVWNVRDQGVTMSIQASQKPVHSVACSPDWRYVLCAAMDNTLRLFDLKRREQLWTMPTEAFDVQFHPSGRYALVRNVGLLELDWECVAGAASATAASVVRSAKRARADAAATPYRRRCALQSMEEIATLQRPGELTGLVALSRDGQKALACGTRLGRYGGSAFANVWDLRSHAVIRQLDAHGDGFSSGYCFDDCHATPDCSYAATAGQSLAVWDLQSGRAIRRLDVEAHCVRLVAGTRYVVSGGRDGALNVWHTATGRLLRSIKAHASAVSLIDVSADGQLALSADIAVPMGKKSSELNVWELATGRCIVRVPVGLTAAAFTRDGKSIIVSVDWTIKLLHATTGEVLRSFQARDYLDHPFPSIDSRYAAFAGYHPMLVNLHSGALHPFSGHTASVGTACLTDDMQMALTADDEGVMKLWRLNWETEEVPPAEWDEGARPFVERFLLQRIPFGAELPTSETPEAAIVEALTRAGRPQLEHGDFEFLMDDLAAAGYGFLERGGVRRELDRMIAEGFSTARSAPASPSSR